MVSPAILHLSSTRNHSTKKEDEKMYGKTFRRQSNLSRFVFTPAR